MHRNWLVSKTNQEFLAYLSNEISISPVLAQILVNRGMKDAGSIKDFLYPSLKKIHDPFLMPDMRAAVDRLRAAIDRDETVLVHGDYDADGITATSLLVSTFNALGLKTCYHIPNRITEGYGLSSKGIEKASAMKADLIVTVDCGISSEAEVAAAGALGMDVIVTDHHEPPETLPSAVAVVDPHRIDSIYPFKYLAGVGVAFKLVQALFLELRVESYESRIEELLDLVALGTIADSVPLTGENRVLVTYGLKRINDSLARTGILALKESAGVNGGSRAGALSFSLIPRINAAGRLDDAGEVVELFLTQDRGRADAVAHLLEEQNRTRQQIEADVLKTALEMIAPDDPGPAIVLSSPDWHPGVIGIVASRLVDLYYRPVFLFSVNGNIVRGSARSIPPFHLYKGIAGCADLLLGYGGHRQAAGLRLELDNLPAFRDRINRAVENELTPEDMVPVLEIEAAVRFSDLSFSLSNQLALLEPYGESNRQPVLGAKGIDIVSQKIVGSNHLKMQLRQDNLSMDTIGFGMGKQIDNLGRASSLDIAFVLGVNEWNGSKNLQLQLKGIRPGRDKILDISK